MADDALLDAEETPKDATPKAPAPVTREDFDHLRGDLKAFAQEVTGAVKAVARPAQDTPPPKTPTPAPDADAELLERFVKDPRGVMGEVMTESLRSTMGPWVQTQASSQAEMLTNTYKAQMDKTYGAGTWDEVISPAMEKILSTMDAPTQVLARGSKPTFEAILKQARGEDSVLEALADRREKVKREPPPELLDNGRPRPVASGLTAEDKEFIQDYTRGGARSIDAKKLLGLIETRRKSSTGDWTVADLGSKNALKFDR